jgi:RNA polymerase sigma factor (sigma-70 family)
MGRGSLQAVLRQVDRLFAEGTSTGWGDDQLLSRFLAAREESNVAFEAIVQRHGPMVLGVCRRVLSDHHAAEDAFQATFLVLARRAGSIGLRPRGSLAPWLHQVACRTARKARVAIMRREARERRVARREWDVVEGDQGTGFHDDRYRVLHEEVARLPEKYRAAVVLCYFEGLTHDQAAESLRWPVGTVRGYLARARDLLRPRLIRRGLAPAVTTAVLAEQPASAATPLAPALVEAVGRAVSRGSATAIVATLAGSTVRALVLTRIRRMLPTFFAMMLGASGVGLLASRLGGSSPDDPPRPGALLVAQPAPKPALTKLPWTGVDMYGDPFPEGAIARMGTTRFNHGTGLWQGVAYALAGRILLSFGSDGIRAWDSSSGKERYFIGRAGSNAYSLAMAPDGRSLMTFDDGDGTFRQWDLLTGGDLRRWRPPKIFAQFMAFSPDGKTLATANLSDKVVNLWDLEHFGQPRQLVGEGDDGGVLHLAFSPDGRNLATAGMGGTPRGGAFFGAAGQNLDPQRGAVRLWDVAKGQEIGHFLVEGCQPRCVTFCADGTILAASYSDATIRLYDVRPGKEAALIRAQNAMQGCLAFSPNGRILASGTHPDMTSGGDIATIHLWDVLDRKEIRHFPAHDQFISGLAFSPDGRTLASAGADNVIRLWEPTSGREIFPSSGHQSGICSLAVSRGDGSVITGGYDGTIRRWNPLTGQELGRIATLRRPVHDPGLLQRPVFDLGIAPSGKLLISGDLGGTVQLWDVDKGTELHRLSTGNGRRVGGIAFGPDGRIAAAAGKIWDVATGRELAPLRDDRGQALWPWASGSVLASPDGKSFVASDSSAVSLWDATTGRQIRQFATPGQSILSIALSPDGRFLATALQEDRTIRLWHLASGREMAILRGATDVSPTLAFSSDGRLLASGSGDYARSDDQSVRLWELVSGREVRRFEGHRAGVTKVAFLPDGRSLVSSSADGTALVWDITGLGRDPTPPAREGIAPGPEALWSDLGGDEAARAYRAIWALAAVGKRVVPFLAVRLKPIEPNGSKPDSSLGPVASGETLRRLRAIVVLEKIGTPEARRVLERLASGLEGARETRDAMAALRRLK